MLKITSVTLTRNAGQGIETLEVTLELPLWKRILQGRRTETVILQRTMLRRIVHGTYKHWVHPGPWKTEDGELVCAGNFAGLLSMKEVTDALAQD